VKLESIALFNFQAHKHLVLGLSPTLTTIKGPTDAGKSAVLRALRWVCLNDMPGVEFIKEGTKRVSVALHVTDGSGAHAVITRIKSKDGSVNTYALDDREYKAFGQGVPADIAQGLALSEINFQGQHDPPFWFSDTAGEVSRKLNSVIDLSIIDTTLANIGSAVRSAQERKSLCEERLVSAKNLLEELAPQRERVAEFKTLKETGEECIETDRSWNQLVGIVERIRANQARTLASQAEDGAALLASMLAARRAQRAVQVLQELSTQAAQLRAVQPPPDFLPVTRAWHNWGESTLRWDSLARLAELIMKKQASVLALRLGAERAEEQFHQQVKGKSCPLCGQIIATPGQ
jgi:chromosome segregation ATPase